MRRFAWKVWSGQLDTVAQLLFVAAPVAMLLPLFLALDEGNAPIVAKMRLVGGILVALIVVWAVVQGSRRAYGRSTQLSAPYADRMAALCERLEQCMDASVAPFVAEVRAQLSTIYCGMQVPQVLDAAPDHPIRIEALIRRMQSTSSGQEPDRARFVERLRTLHSEWNFEKQRPAIEVNRPRALAFEDDLPQGFDPAFSTIPFHRADYLTHRAILEVTAEDADIREAQGLPLILGAGGILVYPHQRLLLLQQRSGGSDEYAHKLHVFGGAYEPNMQLPGGGYDQDLKANAEREILEESGALVDVGRTLVIVHKESAHRSIADRSATGSGSWKSGLKYLSVHFCGIVLNTHQYDRIRRYSELRPSPEGRVCAVSFRELTHLLRETNRWVPAGWLTVVRWLWFGAPCQNGEPVFSPGAARRVVRDVLGTRRK